MSLLRGIKSLCHLGSGRGIEFGEDFRLFDNQNQVLAYRARDLGSQMKVGRADHP